MKSELKRLREILYNWSPRGPIDSEQHFEATEILERIEEYAERHPLLDYASNKLAELKSELEDLYYRSGKRAKLVASLPTLLSDAMFNIAVIQSSIFPPHE